MSFASYVTRWASRPNLHQRARCTCAATDCSAPSTSTHRLTTSASTSSLKPFICFMNLRISNKEYITDVEYITHSLHAHWTDLVKIANITWLFDSNREGVFAEKLWFKCKWIIKLNSFKKHFSNVQSNSFNDS